MTWSSARRLNSGATGPASGAGYDYGPGGVLTAFGAPGDFDNANGFVENKADNDWTGRSFYAANAFAGTSLPGSLSMGVDASTGRVVISIDANENGLDFVGLLANSAVLAIRISNETAP